MFQVIQSIIFVFLGGLFSILQPPVEEKALIWKPGAVKAICAGDGNSFYLKTSGNPYLIKADLDGKILKTWGFGKSEAQLNSKDSTLLTDLSAMVADKKGNIFFIRSSTAAVYKLENNQIKVFASFSAKAFKNEPNAGVRMDLTIDAANNLFVIDGLTKTIWKINQQGKVENMNLKLKVNLVSKNQPVSEKTYIAATPNKGLFFTSFSDDNPYFPDISFLGANGKLKKMVKGHKDFTNYADGNFPEATALKAYNLKADQKGNLYFADDVSWAAGKTFWHFGSIRRLSPDGDLRTIAACGNQKTETNSITTPYNAAQKGWNLKRLTINGKEVIFKNTSKVKHPSLVYDDEVSTQLEKLGESNYGLFFQTGDDGKILFDVLENGELIVATDNTPLISDGSKGNTITLESNESRIRLTKISLNNGVTCRPIVIHQ